MGRDRRGRAEARPLRLFVAVDVPERVKADLARASEALRAEVPQGRWTRAEGWHVTLKFLGATWPRLLDRVRGAVASAAAAAPPFDTALTELGAFPSPGRARVLWVGLEDPERRFGRLATRLDELLADLVPPERRPFTPHLTLARLDPPVDLRAAAVVGRVVGSEPFRVIELVLYRSHLSAGGARYEPLDRFPLGVDSEHTFG